MSRSEAGKSLRAKVAIVTGASRGIGRAIAKRLARDGAALVLCARGQDALTRVAGEIEQEGGQALVVARDLREPPSAGQLVEAAIGAFGRIDILVNNAGATKRGEFEFLSEEDWSDGFALKFFGTIRLIRAAWSHLKRQAGSVVNIAGIAQYDPWHIQAEFARLNLQGWRFFTIQFG